MYTPRESGIYVMRADGTDVHVLLPATDGQLVAPVDWSG